MCSKIKENSYPTKQTLIISNSHKLATAIKRTAEEVGIFSCANTNSRKIKSINITSNNSKQA